MREKLLREKTRYRRRKNRKPHLKWAFSEAAVLFLRANPPAQHYIEKLRKKHGKAKSLSILAHKLGRAVYFMIKRKKPFSMEAFRIA